MQSSKNYTFLALGDSYTIGEQVRINESFPYQTVNQLRQQKLPFTAPEIIANTGFTTDELNAAIDETVLLTQYDFVSLLIGVNNQYRDRLVEDFEREFEILLNRAIHFAANKPAHVFVLSIPDWGVTPFAAESDGPAIAKAIDAFNVVCKRLTEKHQAHYINITQSQRNDGRDEAFLAADKLHPSGKEYSKWATLLSNQIMQQVKNNLEPQIS
jgi:lysophospholipase L1-like esterase